MSEQAELGGYFAFDSHPAGQPATLPWLPLRMSAAMVSARVEQVHAELGSPDKARVAASVAQLGLTARLISPVLAAAVLSGRRLALAGLRWQPTLGGAFPLSVEAGPPEVATDSRLVDNLAELITAGPVRELLELTVARSVSPLTAWGNVASAVNGAASMIARARPDLATRAAAIGGAVLDGPSLATAWSGAVTADFRRRSCCLIYQLAAGGSAREAVCADCVLQPARARISADSLHETRHYPR